MREHVPMRGECPDHLMDLNFSFDHNFLIRRFRGALRRDFMRIFLFWSRLSARFKAAGKFYSQQCHVSCYLFLPEYVFDDFFFLCSIKKVQLKILDLYFFNKKLSEFYHFPSCSHVNPAHKWKFRQLWHVTWY